MLLYCDSEILNVLQKLFSSITLSAKMQFCFFCALYYGAIAFGVVFLEILIQMLLLLYTNLETTLFFSSRCVTTGGSRGTQVKR